MDAGDIQTVSQIPRARSMSDAQANSLAYTLKVNSQQNKSGIFLLIGGIHLPLSLSISSFVIVVQDHVRKQYLKSINRGFKSPPVHLDTVISELFLTAICIYSLFVLKKKQSFFNVIY